MSRGDELPCGHIVRNDEGQVLAHRRIRDDVLVDDQIGDALDEGIDVELESAPLPGQVWFPQGGDPALVGAGAAAGRGQVVRCAEARHDAQGRIEALGSALRESESALRDPPDAPAFLG